MGRIDHIAILVRLENLTTAVEHYSNLLDISFEGPFESDVTGITFYIDWESGMEIYAPRVRELAEDRFKFLEEHGEGVFRVVFGVPDIDDAVARARGMGHDVPVQLTAFDLNPSWRDRFDRMDEAFVADTVHGVRIAFSQIEPKESEQGV